MTGIRYSDLTMTEISMKPPIVFCLHGLFGQPSDWQFMLEGGQDLYEYVFVDYAHEEALDPSRPLPVWGAQFNKWVLSFGEDRVRYIVGYSLGGRLALHAIQNNPKLWTKAVFVSTHLGLSIPEQRQARLKTDLLFSKRVQKDRWDRVLSSWNAQFQDNQKEPSRSNAEEDRKILAQALQNWSLGAQYDFRETLESMPVNQLWVAGEQDPKYLEILEEIPAISVVKKAVIPASSHRILFEQPSLLKTSIESFLE